MQSRNQYLRVLRESYLKARTKKEKTQILHKSFQHWKDGSGEEVCHQEDTARGGAEAQAEEEEKTNPD